MFQDQGSRLYFHYKFYQLQVTIFCFYYVNIFTTECTTALAISSNMKKYWWWGLKVPPTIGRDNVGENGAWSAVFGSLLLVYKSSSPTIPCLYSVDSELHLHRYLTRGGYRSYTYETSTPVGHSLGAFPIHSFHNPCLLSGLIRYIQLHWSPIF